MKWGLTNYTQWIRFGIDGFQTPVGTEHAAKCVYSSARIVCPTPSSCLNRFEKNPVRFCGEVT